MRHIHYLLMTLVGFVALSISSCQKTPELTLTGPASVDLSVDGGSGTISFTANRDWKVSSSDSWVSVSPSSGSASDGTVTVIVRCNANTTYEDRTATVTVRMEELSQSVTVKQPANFGIVLPTQSYELASDARSLEVTVQANVQYTVAITGDWIKQTGTKGLSTERLSFSVEENKAYEAREGKITIKSQKSGVADQVIRVRQAQKDALIVKDTNFDMPYGGGAIEVKVEANVSFDVTPSVDWIEYAETKAISNSTVCLRVKENETYSKRSGKVEIKQRNGSLSHIISVSQAGRIAVTSIELNKTDIKLKEGETETLVATVKPDNATDKKVSWSSSNAAYATVDETGKVTAIQEGSATITAKAGDKSATCAIVVKNDVPVSSIELSSSLLTLREGETATLVAVVKPDDATDKTLTWSTSDAKIATVDNGKVTAVKEGTAAVIVKAGDIEAKCAITVDNTILLNGNSYHCFILTGSGKYKILCSSCIQVGADNAFVLWNENGQNDIVGLELKGDYIYFEKPSFKKGNAMISILKGDEILDSWYLWSTDEPQFIDGIMDRNLGATSADSNSEDAYGLMFSYGSPFPFPGAKYKDWMLTTEPSAPDGWYVAPGYGFYSDSKMPTMATPMLYCSSHDKYGNSIFWRSSTAYTPCPKGTSILSHAALQTLIGYEPTFDGLNGVLLNNGLFFPAAGYGRGPGSLISGAGIYGGYWGTGIYNNGAVDGRACWFYDGMSKASSYFKGNTLHSIRLRKQ